MGKTTNGLIKALTATAAIAAHRIATDGPADGTVVQATDGTKTLIGITSEIPSAIGERCDVLMAGNIAPVRYGGNVGRGDPLTADAQGRAIVATAAGTRIVGHAEVAGVLDDIGTAYVAPSIL